MIVLVCGGRDFTDYRYVEHVLNTLHQRRAITKVVHGAARGADGLGQRWADRHRILTLPCPADWERHGYRAGPVRNRSMLADSKPNVVVAFPGGTGTQDMVNVTLRAGVPLLDARRRYEQFREATCANTF